ncbi:MAG: hypothetical protein LBS37_00825, partial [Treponema sp.]|nr:hypothetical protein [Treponema sp.]
LLRDQTDHLFQVKSMASRMNEIHPKTKKQCFEGKKIANEWGFPKTSVLGGAESLKSRKSLRGANSP